MYQNPLNIAADAVIVLIILIGILVSTKRGFLRSIGKPIKILLSLFIAVNYSPAVAGAYIEPSIAEPIRTRIVNTLTEKCADVTAETASGSMPTILRWLASLLGIDVTAAAEGAEGSVIEALADAFANPVAHFLAVACAFVGLYIAARLLLWIVLGLFGLIFRRGTIGKIDSIFGFLFGAVFYFMLAWALVALAEFVTGLPAFADNPSLQDFGQGYIYRFFANFKPLDFLLNL